MMLERFIRSRRYVSLCLVVLACYAYFFPRWADWNQNSRFDLVVALVDDQTLAIDRYVANTGDYALFNGHYYSDKAPGMALAGVPVYAAFRALVPDTTLEHLAGSAHRSGALQATLNPDGAGVQPDRLRFFVGLVVTTFVVGVLPAVVLALLFCWLLGCLGSSRREQILATLTYALGTSAFPYANSLVGHQTAACLLFAAFTILFAIRTTRLRRTWLIAVGLLLSYAVITEYAAALIASVLGLYALGTLDSRVQVLGRLIAGSVPPLLALVAHDLGAFGTPWPVGYLHSALWTGVHQSGFISLTYPHVDALLGITFGVHRGLFFLSPYLLLAAVGYRALWQRGWLAEALVLSAAPVLYLLYNSSSAMWTGGFGVGPRYMVAALPFLALPAGAGFASIWRMRAPRVILSVAIAWSFCAIWIETIGGQAFPDYTPNPLFDFSWPRLAAGDVARNVGMLLGLGGWSSLTPLVGFVSLAGALAWMPLPIRVGGWLAARGTPQRRTTWAS